MKTFLEWGAFKTPGQPIRDWVFVSDKSLDEAKAELESQIQELFRDFRTGMPQSVDGKSIIPIKGDPLVTIFDLERIGIHQS